MDKSSNKTNAITDIAQALEKVFKKYTLQTRKYAWKRIISTKGKKEVNKIIKTPTININSIFKTLTFKEYYNYKDNFKK